MKKISKKITFDHITKSIRMPSNSAKKFKEGGALIFDIIINLQIIVGAVLLNIPLLKTKLREFEFS